MGEPVEQQRDHDRAERPWISLVLRAFSRQQRADGDRAVHGGGRVGRHRFIVLKPADRRVRRTEASSR
jgi:hypothetical protein